MAVMALISILLLGLIAAVESTGDDRIDCSQLPLLDCSIDCFPICAGNKTYQETFTNGCLYIAEYCTRNLRKYNYRIKDDKNACPIDCSYMTRCSTECDPICIKSSEKTYQKKFTNYCIFRTTYCDSLKEKLGTKYCINQGECFPGTN